jgi:L-asparaginase II
LLDPDGPLQTAVLAELADAVGRPRAVAVDGCGAPVVAVPLAGLARGFASLPGDDIGRRVLAAGFTHPGLVGGAGRAESALLAAGVVAKPGAEGVFAAAWDASDGRPGARLGAAVKIADGAGRAAAALIVALVAATGGPRISWEPEPPLGGGSPAGRVRVRSGPLRALAVGR